MDKNISRRDALKTIGLSSFAAPTLMDFSARVSENIVELRTDESYLSHKDFDKPLTGIIIGAGKKI